MSGIKFLLDTNFILGILKSNSAVLAGLSLRKILSVECSYSAFSRMELLGFQGITPEKGKEESLILRKLEHFTYLPLTVEIEDRVIDLRKSSKIKLTDAIIVGTALCAGIELLTLDQYLLAIVRSAI